MNYKLKYLINIMKKRVKALIIDTKISTNMLTLRQLIEFQPETDRERKY